MDKIRQISKKKANNAKSFKEVFNMKYVCIACTMLLCTVNLKDRISPHFCLYRSTYTPTWVLESNITDNIRRRLKLRSSNKNFMRYLT